MLHHVVEKVAICMSPDGQCPGTAAFAGTTVARCFSGCTGSIFQDELMYNVRP
jgi:hypothetical protein